MRTIFFTFRWGVNRSHTILKLVQHNKQRSIMFEKIYIAGWDDIKAGDICYGSKGEPLEYVDRGGNIIRLKTQNGKVRTDISNIKLRQHDHYKAFRWLTSPGARIASAAAKGFDYHPRQLIAVGEWYDPTQELNDGVWGNKKVNNGCGVKIAIPDVMPVIWVDDSKIDLDYLPCEIEQVDNLPQQIRAYADVSKAYLDIETTGLNPSTDRITFIGIRNHLGEDCTFTDPDEKKLLAQAIDLLNANKPELMFLHNYSFDIPFIITRCAIHGVSHPFSECDREIQRQIKTTAHPALKRSFKIDEDSPEYGGKMTAYEAFGGKTIIIDTMIAVGLWDTGKKLPNLKLKPSVIHLKLRADTRLELTNDEIQACWLNGDLDRLREYLIFDLEDTQLLADFIMPNIWYQQAYLPGVNLMDLVHKNTGFKIQQMYAYLCPESPHAAVTTSREKAQLRDSKADYGGGLTGAIKGIYRDVAKIDVASLYPSLMVRYRLGSRKDPKGRYISVLAKMLTDRLDYKKKGKAGDKAAAGMAEAIKLLMNSGYGFLGNQGYTFNDMENAALITAHGRVVLKLMCQIIEEQGGVLISADTDGVYFSHPNADLIFDLVSQQLPDGISIELEKQHLIMFSRSKKNYCLYDNHGELLEMKGNSFISHQCPIEAEFTKEYPRILINDGQMKADKYYHDLFNDLVAGNIPIMQIATTEKILKGWKSKMTNLGITEPATVSYYYARHDRHHLSRQYSKSRSYIPLETLSIHHPNIPYFGEYYAYKIECLRAIVLNISDPLKWWNVKEKQLKLALV
jgi:DNA polymerase, archaea type